MRILIFITNEIDYDPRVLNVIDWLKQEGYKITVIGVDWKRKYYLFDFKRDVLFIRLYSPLFKFLPTKYLKIKVYQWLAYQWTKEGTYDLLYCNDYDTLPIGIKLKKKHNKPLIYDIHDIFGFMLMKKYPKWITNQFLKSEKKLLQQADSIIVPTETLKNYYHFTKKPITIIRNVKKLPAGAICGPVKNMREHTAFKVVYFGTLSKGRFLEEAIEVIGNMEDSQDTVLYIGGSGRLKKKLYKMSQKFSNIIFFKNKILPSQILAHTLNSDLVLYMIAPNNQNTNRAFGNKQFEAMVCGRPIICTEDTFSGHITKKYGIGVVTQYSKQAFKETVLYLKNAPSIGEKMGKKALKIAEQYSFEKEGEKFKKEIQNAVNQ